MKFHTHMSESLGTSVYLVFKFGMETKVYYDENGVKPDAEFLDLLKTKKIKFGIWDA